MIILPMPMGGGGSPKILKAMWIVFNVVITAYVISLLLMGTPFREGGYFNFINDSWMLAVISASLINGVALFTVTVEWVSRRFFETEDEKADRLEIEHILGRRKREREEFEGAQNLMLDQAKHPVISDPDVEVPLDERLYCHGDRRSENEPLAIKDLKSAIGKQAARNAEGLYPGEVMGVGDGKYVRRIK